jgi:hypothetical protein
VLDALLVGVALRLAWAYLVPVMPLSDGAIYDEFARSLASGRGYAYADGTLTAYWPVGTSAVYALLYRVFGHDYGAIVALNIALGAGLIALTHAFATRRFGASVGRAAAWLVACWPLLIQFTTVLASELLFAFLVLAAVFVEGTRSMPLAWRAAAWGALVCAATYVRPTALPLLLVLPVLQGLSAGRWREPLLSMAIAALTAAALFAPWVARNHDVFGRFVLVSTNFGPNLWMGNNPRTTGAYMALDRAMTNEAGQDAQYRQRALEFIAAHPARYAELSLKRLVATHDRESIGVAWNEAGLVAGFGARVLTPLKALSSAWWWAMLVAGVAGMVAAVRMGAVGRLDALVIVPLIFVAVPMLTVSQDRYHVPLNPWLAMFGALALVELRSRLGALPARARAATMQPTGPQ